jgi:Indolepyruvate ferredoxin oxidoreductase, alpha and beta subunits
MKKTFDKEKCTGCGVCVINCPIKIMEVSSTEVNKKGKATSYVIDESKCINCMICAKMCPYFAINFEDNGKNITFPKLMENVEIPFHNGCYQGLIERLVAETIEELDIAKDIIIFKPEMARFTVNVEIKALPMEKYFEEALIYKRNNPNKIVLIWYVDEEPWQHEQALKDFKNLKNSSVTIIHMLNYFSELKENPNSPNCAEDLCDYLSKSSEATFVSRGSFKNLGSQNQTKLQITKAILNQEKNKGFSLAEITLPCHWRIEGRPTKEIVFSQVKENIEWFNKEIIKKYPLGIFKNVTT